MTQKEKKKRFALPRGLKITLIAILLLGILSVGTLFGIDAYVRFSVSDRILTEKQAAQLQDIDCIVVLGCKVYDDGTPSAMLEDRLKRSISLYKLGAAPKLLMSGDHGQTSYDEVNAMKQYAVDNGIPSVDVFMDHAGFSTYETMYRAKEVFCAKKILIVTQEYHLYRSLYIAQALGLEAYGVSANYRRYANQSGMDLREILARVKDFGMCIVKPEPTYLGSTIPVSGSGEATHDKNSNFD